MHSPEAALGREGQLIREAAFLGIGINYLLWGVQIAQSYYYYTSYRTTDGWWPKGAVSLLFIADALQSIFTSALCWNFMVLGLSEPDQPIGWGGNAVPFMATFTASIVHVTYAQKIWTLLYHPYNYIFTALVLALSALELTAGIGCTTLEGVISLTFSEFGRIKHWAIIWLVTAAATDILITVIMTWKLSASRTGIKRTDDLISKLIRLIVETGLATAVVQIVDIVLYLIWPSLPYHMILAIFSPKVYSNSMLALFNSRKTHRDGDSCCSCQTMPTTSIAIRTTHTVNVSHDYELTERPTPSVESFPPKKDA